MSCTTALDKSLRPPLLKRATALGYVGTGTKAECVTYISSFIWGKLGLAP